MAKAYSRYAASQRLEGDMLNYLPYIESGELKRITGKVNKFQCPVCSGELVVASNGVGKCITKHCSEKKIKDALTPNHTQLTLGELVKPVVPVVLLDEEQDEQVEPVKETYKPFDESRRYDHIYKEFCEGSGIPRDAVDAWIKDGSIFVPDKSKGEFGLYQFFEHWKDKYGDPMPEYKKEGMAKFELRQNIWACRVIDLLIPKNKVAGQYKRDPKLVAKQQAEIDDQIARGIIPKNKKPGKYYSPFGISPVKPIVLPFTDKLKGLLEFKANPNTNEGFKKALKILPVLNELDFKSLPSRFIHQIIKALAQINLSNQLDQNSFDLNWINIIDNPKGYPIIITEGAKKAAVLMAHGYPAIGLCGVANGFIGKDENKTKKYQKPQLIPELELLAKEGVQFLFAFDNDSKETTQKNVGNEISKLCKELKRRTKVTPKIILWDEFNSKGVDDLVVDHGAIALHTAVANAKPYSAWACNFNLSLFAEKDVVVNQQYFGNLNIPEDATDATLITLKGSQGTGKTQSTKPFIKKLQAKGEFIFIIVPRIQLGQNLSKEFDIPFFSNEIDEELISSKKGAIVCWDSIKKVQRFIDRHECYFNLFVDEVTQGLWHLLTANTAVENDRVGNLEAFLQLVNSSNRLIAADADLNTFTLKFLQQIKKGKSFIAENNYKFEREIYNYPSPARMMLDIEVICSEMEQDKRAGKEIKSIWISSQGANFGSKFGTHNLEKRLKLKFPNLEIIREDAVTLNDPDHISSNDEFMKNINIHIRKYDVVIVSPSLSTGVSIKEGHRFSHVFGFCQGILSPMDAVQQLSRVRGDKVQRGFYAGQMKGSQIGNNAYSADALKNHFRYKFNCLKLALRKGIKKSSADDANTAEFQSFISISEDLDPNFLIDFYCQWGAMLNQATSHNQDWMEEILKSQGYTIIDVDVHQELLKESKQIDNEMYLITEESKESNYEAIASAEEIDEPTKLELAEKIKTTPTQREQLAKARLKDKVGDSIPLTSDLVRKEKENKIPFTYKVGYLFSLLNWDELNLYEEALRLDKSSKNNKIFLPHSLKRSKAAAIALLRDLGVDDLISKYLGIDNHSSTDENGQLNPNSGCNSHIDLIDQKVIPNLVDRDKDQKISRNFKKLSQKDLDLLPSLSTQDETINKFCKRVRDASYHIGSLLSRRVTEKTRNHTIINDLLTLFGLKLKPVRKSNTNYFYKIEGADRDYCAYFNHLGSVRDDQKRFEKIRSDVMEMPLYDHKPITDFVEEAIAGAYDTNYSESIDDMRMVGRAKIRTKEILEQLEDKPKPITKAEKLAQKESISKASPKSKQAIALRWDEGLGKRYINALESGNTAVLDKAIATQKEFYPNLPTTQPTPKPTPKPVPMSQEPAFTFADIVNDGYALLNGDNPLKVVESNIHRTTFEDAKGKRYEFNSLSSGAGKLTPLNSDRLSALIANKRELGAKGEYLINNLITKLKVVGAGKLLDGLV
jgi:hypothetical protein